MTELMARRGPDDEGFADSAHLSLGFRRLAVLDLSSDGHQPMVTPDGAHTLVFNGEVYNYRELGRELERTHGVTFRSRTDTEVVLQALRLFGADALPRFNGMFSLALWEEPSRTLLLARDPVGIKPLYWLDDQRGIVFGSQYDQIVRHPWCNRERTQADVLTLYLRLGYVPSPYGLIEGTHQLEPGCLLTISPGRSARVQRYSDYPEARPVADEPALYATLGAAVDRSVGRQMASDVPIGSFLSGGVDSPLVTAAMARHSGTGLPAFTVSTDNAEMDEAPAARRYANEIGCEHVVARITGSEALDRVEDLTLAFGEPFADYSALPTLLVSELARGSVKVALSGDGGDELFWGYPRFAKLLRNRNWFRVPRALRLFAYAATRHRSFGPAKGALFRDLGTWYLNAHSRLREPYLSQLGSGVGSLPGDFTLYQLDSVPERADLADWLRLNELRGHLEMVLAKVDRASMFHSLEVRVPLLDRDVAETAFTAPSQICIREGMGKLPLREVLGRSVPPGLIDTAKRGFTVPLGGWLRQELSHLVTEQLVEEPLYLPEVFGQPVVRQLVHEHRTGADHTAALWVLLALQLWARAHLRPLPSSGVARSGSGWRAY